MSRSFDEALGIRPKYEGDIQPKSSTDEILHLILAESKKQTAHLLVIRWLMVIGWLLAIGECVANFVR